MLNQKIRAFAFVYLLFTASIAQAADLFMWLEEVEGTRALSWVDQQNQRTHSVLELDSRFAPFKAEALSIYEATDRIPYGEIRGDYVYNFRRSEDHARGVWRRTTLADYENANPTWEILLDVDALAEQEVEYRRQIK